MKRDYLLKAQSVEIVTPAIEQIMIEVAAKHGLSVTDLLSARQCHHIARPRQEAMYRASKETLASITEIGRCFDKDRATIKHGIRQHEKRMGI